MQSPIRNYLILLNSIFGFLFMEREPFMPDCNSFLSVKFMFVISEPYKQLFQIELFFKMIKQKIKIKKFSVRSEKAVKTRICIEPIIFVSAHSYIYFNFFMFIV